MELMILYSLITQDVIFCGVRSFTGQLFAELWKNSCSCIYRMSNHNFILYSISTVPEWMAYTQRGGEDKNNSVCFLQKWNSFEQQNNQGEHKRWFKMC